MKVFYSMLFFLVPFVAFFQECHASNEEAYQYLDGLALQFQADKGSFYHNYTEIYARHFSSLKDAPIKFLEIGIHKAASVQLWEAYFSKADLHFIDITFNNASYQSSRSHYHLVNQEDRNDLNQFIQATGGGFDIIIDDGGHTMRQQKISFITLFPHLNSGGMYVIEDLHTSYWPSFGGGDHKKTTVQFLKNLIDDVNFVGQQTAKANHKDLSPDYLDKLNTFQKDILSLTFYDSLAIITKR